MKSDDRKRLLNFHDDEEMSNKASTMMTSSSTNNNADSSSSSLDSSRTSCSCNGGNPIKFFLPEHMKCYWKTILLAFFLLVCGISLLIIAVYIVLLPDSINGPHSYVFFLCGFICVVPGAYHVIYIFFASRGKDGYKLEELPTFSDD